MGAATTDPVRNARRSVIGPLAILVLALGNILAGTAHAAVDPRNLISSGNLGLNPSQSVGQTFVTKFEGRLLGIEFAPQLDSAAFGDVIDLELFNRLGGTIATASIPVNAFPPGNGVPAALSTTSTGPGYFDLSSFMIQIAPDDSLRFILTKASSGTARAGISTNLYADGTSIVNGSPSALFDLAFKVVFVPVPKLLVGAANDSTVLGYDALTGAALGQFTHGTTGTLGPSSLVIGNSMQSLFVKTWSGPRIDEYDALRGTFLRTLVSSDVRSGGGSMTIGSDNRIYAPNSSGGITRWSIVTGASAGQFVAPGSGGLGGVGGMAFGPDGNLYVGSLNFLTGQHQVLRYNGATGAFINAFVPSGSGGLIGPDALVFGPGGDLFVTSRNTNNVLRFNGTTGAFLGVFASGGGLFVPFGMVFGPDGNLYVSSSGTDQVLRYDGTTGAFLDVFATNTHAAPTGVIFNEGELPEIVVDDVRVAATERPQELLRIAPNPAWSGTRVAFDLPGATAVRLAVYDVRGRFVRTLLDGDRLDAGRHFVSWDARNGDGQHVPAGVYFVRLSASGLSGGQRVVVLDRR